MAVVPVRYFCSGVDAHTLPSCDVALAILRTVEAVLDLDSVDVNITNGVRTHLLVTRGSVPIIVTGAPTSLTGSVT